jgi:hypothetical protein
MVARATISFKRRQRGSASRDLGRLKKLYDNACCRRRPNVKEPDAFYAATGGDPLLVDDRNLAMKVYGLSGAARPTAEIRRIASAVWGDTLAQMAEEAREFQKRRDCSDSKAAAEVVVQCAQHGSFLGVHAPRSFNDAVKLVRKAMGALRRNGERKYQRTGWTGEYLHVRPADGFVVRNPENLAVPLHPNGALVPDDLFWRRCLRDGDVLLIEKRPTTV